MAVCPFPPESKAAPTRWNRIQGPKIAMIAQEISKLILPVHCMYPPQLLVLCAIDWHTPHQWYWYMNCVDQLWSTHHLHFASRPPPSSQECLATDGTGLMWQVGPSIFDWGFPDSPWFCYPPIYRWLVQTPIITNNHQPTRVGKNCSNDGGMAGCYGYHPIPRWFKHPFCMVPSMATKSPWFRMFLGVQSMVSDVYGV